MFESNFAEAGLTPGTTFGGRSGLKSGHYNGKRGHGMPCPYGKREGQLRLRKLG